MNQERFNRRLFQFIQDAPTPFHCCQTMAGQLQEAGFTRLHERDSWNLAREHAYYLIRDNGSLIGFTLGQEDPVTSGFRMLGAHTDSPALKIKPTPDQTTNSYHQLGVEPYGSPLLHTWFDRELSIGGRACCSTSDGRIHTLLLNLHHPMAMIPSLAIHLKKDANKENPINAQTDLPLLFSQSIPGHKEKKDLDTLVFRHLRHQYPDLGLKELLSTDLFCYASRPPSFFGAQNQFISSPRLDNLLSCCVGVTALTNSHRQHNTLLICSNHEEVGSTTMSGATGSFLPSLLRRILPDHDKRQRSLAGSFMISMDNAHALHPNYADKSDSTHPVLLNHGPVIKTNANQRYATNSLSRSLYMMIAREAGVDTQDFVMRSDLGCGSTIGPLLAAELGLLTIDIGAPTLAMHSFRETTGASDPAALYTTILHFLNRSTTPMESICIC